jgi:hypothetical protein
MTLSEKRKLARKIHKMRMKPPTKRFENGGVLDNATLEKFVIAFTKANPQ